MTNRCNACGKLFVDHIGIIGTCRDNLKLREALVGLLSMLQQERQFCDTVAVRHAERALDGKSTEQGDGDD